MAVRTTAGDVQGVLGINYDKKTPLDGFIATATAVTDQCAVRAAAKDITLSSTDLELIERWLAAHYYALSDPPFKKTTITGPQGGAGGEVMGTTGLYFEATYYGQVAMMLDRGGYLSAIGSQSGRKIASAVWLGTEAEEATA